MPLAEVIAFEVGSAIAKSILKLWLKDATLAQDISSSLLDLLKARTSDKIAQRRGQWQFEAIGEKVGENLLPLFLAEDHKLDEASLTAVAMAVAETLDKAKISSKLLAERNLEPFNLAKYAMATSPTATRYFSETESALYQRIINESCQYIVDIASQLPSFTERSFAEVLKREDELIAKTNQVLQEIQRMREQLDPMAQSAKFELEYRRAVARNLDVLELYGTDVSLISRRHRLSVAYVTLSVKQDSLSSHKRGYSGPIAAVPDIAKSQDKTDRSIVSVEEALVSARRLLIWGAAGSGKTTLLQWIAIKSASKAFEGQLSSWGSTIPFYIRLRQSIHTSLPAPEAFPKLITPAIADKMPQGWVHNELESGRAIVLVDGLDEVPLLGWEDVRIWLADLIANYPKARFIITSRPHAVEETWFKDEGFIDAELQPMELPDIHTFIDHWHEAVAEELHEEKEKAEVPLLAKQLKGEVERNRSKRNLAANPLLCAMLCALNRDRRQQLPSDRIELYEACCAMLLERRDKERGIDLAKYPALNYRQKRVLLEDLAYWLVRNGWSEIKQELVDKRFSQTLTNMQGLPQNTTGVGVRLLFVERTGFIREPVPGHIDFTHRTFQEFLAAQAALDEGDIGMLVQNAHNHLWRDVIILACGLATKPECEQLINELIIRGDKEKEYRYQLHLLAISCLETAIRVGPEVREKLIKRLGKLVPPKDMQDARSLAAAGELAVPYLAKKVNTPLLSLPHVSML